MDESEIFPACDESNSICVNEDVSFSGVGFRCVCLEGFESINGICVPVPYEASGDVEVTVAPTVDNNWNNYVTQCDAGFLQSFSSNYGGESFDHQNDIDECTFEYNHGDCENNGYDSCFNYFGGHKCFNDGDADVEVNFCHHTSSRDGDYYRCQCFCGYHLCADGFTCIADESPEEADLDCVSINSEPSAVNYDFNEGSRSGYGGANGDSWCYSNFSGKV